MSTKYTYTGKTTEPTFRTYDVLHVLDGGIHFDVDNSTMTDKTIEYCRWDAESADLNVYFTNALSTDDKTKLDTIVVNNS